MCMTSFLKRWKVVVGQNECLRRSNRPKGSLKGVVRNFAEFTRKHMREKNQTLAQVFSCEFCEICKNTFFAEHHRTTASSYSSVNSSERRINKRNGKLWYKNWSIGANLSQKLPKSAFQVKEKILEAVVCRCSSK